MCDYRLYFFDENDHVCESRLIQAENDLVALTKAHADRDRPVKAELWLADERVALIESDTPLLRRG